jgi:DNA-binding FadR family transcriptional regulator
MAFPRPKASQTDPGERADRPAWQKLQPTSASANIIAQVRRALFDGQLNPGDFLGTEQELAEQFGVSRFPVRDALRTLEAQGIVAIRTGAGGGAFIAAANPDVVADAMAVQLQLLGLTDHEATDAQIALEGYAAELAATNASAEDLAVLEQIVEELGSMRDAPVPFLERSADFHVALAEAAHSRALAAQIKMMWRMLTARYRPYATPGGTERVLRRHKELLQRLKRRDGAAARAMIVEHIEDIRSKVFAKD